MTSEKNKPRRQIFGQTLGNGNRTAEIRIAAWKTASSEIRDSRGLDYLFTSGCTCVRNVCTVLWLISLMSLIFICSTITNYIKTKFVRPTVEDTQHRVIIPRKCDDVIRTKDVYLISCCNKRKKSKKELLSYMKNVNEFLGKEPKQEVSTKKILKYWYGQNKLFRKFSSGILLDEESFYSVCPETLCRHIAQKCKCEKIIDPFCGAGGNIIQFANTCRQVIGIDVDENKIKLARNNARVYNVENKIKFQVGNYFQRDHTLQSDVVYMSPPWGGPEYLNQPLYSLAGMCGDHGGGKRVIQIALEIAPKVAIHLPRNIDKGECVDIVRSLGVNYVLFENNYVDERLNSITMFLK